MQGDLSSQRIEAVDPHGWLRPTTDDKEIGEFRTRNPEPGTRNSQNLFTQFSKIPLPCFVRWV